MSETCTWCGAEVEADDGFRAYEPAGERRATFCRLEHVIPWSIQGPHWEAGAIPEGAPQAKPRSDPISDGPTLDRGATECSHCGTELGDAHVLLVRHRGEHRVADAFCGVDHMNEWAKAGGRWQ
jgi:hypothetical protein